MEQSVFDLDHLPRTYFRLALPVTLNMVVTLIYNLADTWFIARTGDADLVAGVALCSPVFTALMAFGNIYGQGGSSLISRMLGKGDETGVRRVSAFCFYVALLTGAVLAILSMAFRGPLLRLIGADARTAPFASEYFSVLAVCAPIVVASFIHSNLLRCEGLASAAVAGTMGGTILNIILDPILISVAGWGARGAAIATVIGYAASDIFLLFVLRRKSRYMSVAPRDAKVSGEELRGILAVGLTAAIANLTSSLSLVVMNKYLAAYGSVRVAAMGIALKVNMVAQLLLVGFSFGGVPLFGFLWGAGDRARLKKLTGFCLGFLCALASLLSAVLILAAPRLLAGFMDLSEVVAEGAVMLRWQAAGNVFAAVVLLLTCLFQAAGRAGPALIMSLSRQGVVFVAVLAAATALAGYQGLLVSQALADFLSALLGLLLCRAVFRESGK